jgi:hypothetical protein
MNNYPSSIVFLYYEDYTFGVKFMSEVLDLKSVMDQGFAQVFQVSETSYIGVVDAKGKKSVSGDTLISLNSNCVDEAFKRLSQLEVYQTSPRKLPVQGKS